MDWLEVKEFFKDTIKYVIFIIVILIIAIYVVGLQLVSGDSMNPNFHNYDVLLLDKISYNFLDIKRYDVVAFKNDDTVYLIKRIIGLPGENVEFHDNILYIDGTPVKDEYAMGITEDFSLSDLGFDKIPDDMYFVLGDNRADSLDSRDSTVGLVAKKNIIGKVRIRIWPLNKIKFIK